MRNKMILPKHCLILILILAPSFCVRYPWSDWKQFENIVQWLYLTDVQRPQDQHLILLEYFQLVMACCYATTLSKTGTDLKYSSLMDSMP